MIVGFLIGLMVGGSLGVLVMGLLVAGSRADELNERLSRSSHSCGGRCSPLAGIHVEEWGSPVR